jgi:hypothetical protein
MFTEVVTDPLGAEDLWNDLLLNLNHIEALGISQVTLFFGFAWGKHIYVGEDTWHELPMGVDAVETMIRRACDQGYGRLGDDNLYLSVPDLAVRLQYSHEMDIHLSFSEHNPFVKTVLERWKDNQWFMAPQPR